MRLDIGERKTVLVPRQALLHKLGPSGELTVPAVRTRLEPLVHQYEKLILHDKVEAGMTLKDALKIYNYFHALAAMSAQGPRDTGQGPAFGRPPAAGGPGRRWVVLVLY